MRVTAGNIVSVINQLPRNIEYNYINARNKGKIEIYDVVLPEGPIKFRRYDASKNQVLAEAKIESISVSMLWVLANAIKEDKPVNIDRVYNGSYNTRSVLETLIVHTPQFYFCMPGRIQVTTNSKEIKKGHKHIVYRPNEPHQNGLLEETHADYQITEISHEVVQKGLELSDPVPGDTKTIEQKREHARIQIALILIGQQLGFRTWVAQNDRGVEYEGRKLIEMEGVIDRLATEQVVSAYPRAIEAAKLIDCIWFKNGRLMPAVMEIELSTGVTSGLNRMKGFYDTGPNLRDVRWTIVAPDEDREKVLRKAQAEQFRELDSKFFSYSAVMELYSICERRKIRGVNDEFLDCFMEPCIVC